MAYIANTAFEARVSNNKNDDLCNVTGRYQETSADAICSAGILCIRNGNLPCEGFTDINNENAWYMNAAGATVNASTPVYAANTYDWPTVQDSRTGNVYAIGTATLGLPIPAGKDGTFTIIKFDGQHRYRFGIGNVNGTLGSNKYFTIAAGQLVPAAAAPTDNGAIYFELAGQGNFTEGATQSFAYVDVIAHTAIVKSGS